MADKEALGRIADPRRRASIKLAIIARQLHALFDDLTSDLGITRSQSGALGVIHMRPGITQREIAEKLEITEVSAGRLVDRLVAEGFAERRPHEADRRAHAIFVSAKGEALTERLEEYAGRAEAIAWEGFDDKAMAEFNESLDRLYDNLARPK